MDDSTRQQLIAKLAELQTQRVRLEATAMQLNNDIQATGGAIQLCEMLLAEPVELPKEAKP